MLYSSLFSATSIDNTLKSLRSQLKIYLSSAVGAISYHPLLLIHEPQFNQYRLKRKGFFPRTNKATIFDANELSETYSMFFNSSRVRVLSSP